MKDQKTNKEKQTKKAFGTTFTLNEDLNKYLGPEFTPPKLKKIEEKFSKHLVHY